MRFQDRSQLFVLVVLVHVEGLLELVTKVTGGVRASVSVLHVADFVGGSLGSRLLAAWCCSSEEESAHESRRHLEVGTD